MEKNDRNTIEIILRYRPVYNEGDRVVSAGEAIVPLTKELSVGPNTDIADILPQIHGSRLALWDETAGRPSGDYVDHGRLEPGKVYNILSSDVRKTIDFMRRR